MEDARAGFVGRMSLAHLVQIPAEIFRPSLTRSSGLSSREPKCLRLTKVNGQQQIATWVTDGALLTELSTRNIGVSPNEEKESSLSLTLQETVPGKYSLSPKACSGLERRMINHGMIIPEQLLTALQKQITQGDSQTVI